MLPYFVYFQLYCLFYIGVFLETIETIKVISLNKKKTKKVIEIDRKKYRNRNRKKGSRKSI